MELALLVGGLVALFSVGNNLSKSTLKLRQFGTLLGILCFCWAFLTGFAVEDEYTILYSLIAQSLLAAIVTGSAWIVLPLSARLFSAPLSLLYSVLKPLVLFARACILKPITFFKNRRLHRQNLHDQGLEHRRQHDGNEKDNLKYDLQLEYKSVRSVVSETISESEFNQLVDSALATDNANERNRRIHKLRELLRSYHVEQQPTEQSLESIAAEFVKRRADIEASPYDDQQKKKLLRWVNWSEEMRVQKFMKEQ